MTETDMLHMSTGRNVVHRRVVGANVRLGVSEVQLELWRLIGMKALPRKVVSTTIQL
jgi:hypothetical protein